MTDAQNGPAARLTAAVVLATVVMLSLYLKLRLSTGAAPFNPEDETGYFSSESAFQYRYARMLAEGRPIPELDRDAQYPEGVRTGRELTLGMEYVTAWAYRLLPRSEAPDFRWFVVLWVAFFSSLTIPGLYAAGLRLTRSPPLALAAASAFGLSVAAQSNLIGNYEFESFAMPLIAASLACLAGALDLRERAPRPYAAGAGFFLAAALASWHFTRFYLASLLAAYLYASWRSRRDPDALARLRESLGFLLAFAVAAGFLVGPLRESLLVASPVMAVGYGLWLALRFPRQAAWAAAATAFAAACLALGSRDPASYGHVYGLFFAKLQHGLVKPADPSALSQEARMLWMGPFNSPGASFLMFMLLPMAALLLPRAWALARPRKAGAQAEPGPFGDLVDALFVLYLGGEILVMRLTPFLALFLCLAGLRAPRRTIAKGWFLALFIAVAALEGFKSYAPASRYNPFMRIAAPFAPVERQPASSIGDYIDVLHWLNSHGRPGTPVLTNIALSASVLTYTSCPVLLQPKFEAAGIREKTARFLEALYSTEDDFAAFCRKFGARFFVYTADDILDESSDGLRYASGRPGLRSDSAAVLFHFRPGELKHFRLVYQNQDFRIFSVDPSGGQPEFTADTPPIYDIAQFKPQTLPDGSLRLDVAGVMDRIDRSREKLFLARLLARLNQGQAALSSYEESFAAWPPDRQVRDEARRLKAALEARAAR